MPKKAIITMTRRIVPLEDHSLTHPMGVLGCILFLSTLLNVNSALADDISASAEEPSSPANPISTEPTTSAPISTSKPQSSISKAAGTHDKSLYVLKTQDPDLLFIEQQIYRNESSAAVDALETRISQIEAARNRYDADLVVPLTLYGDALMVQQKFDQALDQYDRARHVARVSNGLFADIQLPIVYREADAFKTIGDIDSVASREQYAYEIAARAFGKYDLKLLPALNRLADFYVQTFSYLSARALYTKALEIYEMNGMANEVDAIPTLQGLAKSHRIARFPPFYVHNASDNSAYEGPLPSLNSDDLSRQHIAFNNFPAGEKALQKVVEIRRTAQPYDPEAEAQAIIELGDWHLLFGRSQAAHILYSHVLNEIDSKYPQQTQQNRFAEPTLIYFPKPENPRLPKVYQPQNIEQGFVTLGFGLSTSGRARKLRTLETQPAKLMEFRVRRSMRLAVYRPAFEEGVAIAIEDQEFTHTFPYLAQQVNESSDAEPEIQPNEQVNKTPNEQPQPMEQEEPSTTAEEENKLEPSSKNT